MSDLLGLFGLHVSQIYRARPDPEDAKEHLRRVDADTAFLPTVCPEYGSDCLYKHGLRAPRWMI